MEAAHRAASIFVCPKAKIDAFIGAIMSKMADGIILINKRCHTSRTD